MNERLPQPAEDQAILPVDVFGLEINTRCLPEDLVYVLGFGGEDLNRQGLDMALPDKAMPTPSHLPSYRFATTSA
jgi:hypothetical protein